MPDIDQFVAILRLDPSETGGPSRMDMLRQRQEAASLIEELAARQAFWGTLAVSMEAIAPTLQVILEEGRLELPASVRKDLERGLKLYLESKSETN